jgi:hypothetical protein
MAGRNARAIDLDDLHSELQRTKEQVEAWSRETVQFGAAHKDQHSKRMSTLRGGRRNTPSTGTARIAARLWTSSRICASQGR